MIQYCCWLLPRIYKVILYHPLRIPQAFPFCHLSGYLLVSVLRMVFDKEFCHALPAVAVGAPAPVYCCDAVRAAAAVIACVCSCDFLPSLLFLGSQLYCICCPKSF